MTKPPSGTGPSPLALARTLSRRAAKEYAGLVEVAQAVQDDVWSGWVLPPGSRLVVTISPGVPANAEDAVKRIGNGIAEAVLAPLQMGGLFAANRLLDVLSHGNVASAMVMIAAEEDELPEPLAAAVVHVAAASGTAVVTALLEPPTDITNSMAALANTVAKRASEVHHLPLGHRAGSRRLARARTVTAIDIRSDIERNPTAAPTMTEAARPFLARHALSLNSSLKAWANPSRESHSAGRPSRCP